MMNKKFGIALVALLPALCLSLGLAACGGENGGPTTHVHTYTVENVCSGCGDKWEYTEGLSYKLDMVTDTYTVAGVDTALDGVEELALVIPYGYQGKFVTAIDEFAFWGYDELTSVTIPGSVKTIETEAFACCNALTRIELPDSAIEIWNGAFSETGYYNDPANWDESGVLYLDDYLLVADEEKLPESYQIRDNTRAIAEYAFENCSGLTSVTIPDSVQTIGDYAFQFCSELKNIAIGNGVTSIGRFVFMGTAYYDDPANRDESGVLYLGDYLLIADVMQVLGNYQVRANTRIIADYAFMSDYGPWMGCYTLTGIAIPDSVITIGDYAFYDCVELTNVTIGNGVTTIGDYAFEMCGKLTNLAFGNHVTSIGKNAFGGCSGLTSIELPKSVTEIGSAAFSYCVELTSIEIPKSVTEIGSGAFSYCVELTEIHYAGTIDEWKEIKKTDELEPQVSNYTVVCTDGTIAADGTETRK